MNRNNLILDTDSYKASHAFQYPEGSQFVFSYIEARGNDEGHTYVIPFGLQGFLKAYFSTPITFEDIVEAEAVFKAHGEPFHREGWMHILNKHGGKLPLEIRAVPEGTVFPLSMPMVTVVNTDPECYWLPSYFETAILRGVWYGTSVATISHRIKQVLKQYHADTSDAPVESINFKLHDFGYRGVSSRESGMIGGCAHLVNFMGTDTVGALIQAANYYGCAMAGFSIPAAEHSTITTHGREGEVDAYRRMLKQFAKPGSLVAVVSDSYDIYNAASNIWGGLLKDEVIASGATIIVRPDSGHPATVVPNIIERLMEKFGYETNSKGYRVLPSCIRVIQGDGINETSIREILAEMKAAKQSVDNIAFGMGGALLQHVNRDTYKFAMKASAICINGEWRKVMKDPVTDTGKRSKAGVLALQKTPTGYHYTTLSGPGGWSDYPNALERVFLNGDVLANDTLDQIRARAAS